jgi:YD repeat-containing protein
MTPRTVYDANGRSLVTVDRHVPNTSANGSRTIYHSIGRVVRTERLANVVDALGNRTEYEYDNNGRLRTITDAKGRDAEIQAKSLDFSAASTTFDGGPEIKIPISKSFSDGQIDFAVQPLDDTTVEVLFRPLNSYQGATTT